jgi:hypothetical protein
VLEWSAKFAFEYLMWSPLPKDDPAFYGVTEEKSDD